MLYHAHTPEDVIAELRSSKHGLHQIYAEGRLKHYGRNNIRLSRRPLVRRIYEPLLNVFTAILIVAAIISIALGDYTTGGLLAATVIAYIGLRYLQDWSVERTVKHTEQHVLPPVTVLRDGITADMNPSCVVPGDIIILNKGDRVPGDGRIIHAQSLHINQIHLTGSSGPIAKNAKTLSSNTPLEEQANMVFRGSYVTSGTAQYIITATGNDTYYGQLHSSLIKAESTGYLQQKINRLVTQIALIAAIVVLVMGALSFLRGIPLDTTLQYSIAMLIAVIPESLPIAVGVVMAISLRRISQHGALITTAHSVESTSVASALASDKTGMLTHDKLVVKEIWQPSQSQRTPETMADKTFIRHTGDARDAALIAYLHRQKHKVTPYNPVVSFDFTRDIGMSGNLWHDGTAYQLYIKGTPEKILNRASLTSAEQENAEHELHRLASQGYHIIALAHTRLSSPITKLTSLPKRHMLEFDGFIALQDHVRPDVRSSIAHATQAGIVTHIVTGDHVETAYRLGQRLGLVASRNQVLDSRKLDNLSDAQLARVSRNTIIFARVTPTHKQRILSALKRSHVVMMTGDSIDDVPVLLNAQVGIASTQGSQVARDASDMLLLNDRFSDILEAVKQSRTILGNIRRMVFHVAVLGLTELLIVIGSLLIGVPIALLPLQLLWLNLVVATAVLVPLGLEPHSRNIMSRKPVSPRAPILPRYLVIRVFLLAGTIATATIALFLYSYTETTLSYARSMAFVAVTTMLVVTALIARSDHTSTLVRFRTWSPAVYLGITILTIAHGILYVTPVWGLLQLVPISLHNLLVGLAVGIAAPLVVTELHKLYSRRIVRSKGRSY